MSQDQPQLDNSDYTVGWITALHFERTAAESMLDEQHAPPKQKHENDHNNYALGSIIGPNGNKHNVVIATLPSERYGTTPATATAIQLLSSFPAIKFGLMVGTGGGIPSEETDIRLGDVVVGNDNNCGGVRQYDFEKVTTNGVEKLGALNAPPRVLLSALSTLRSKHEKLGSDVPAILEDMRKNYPVMVKPRQGTGYVYQGAEHDRLFEPGYIHTVGSRDCSQCDRKKEVRREERADLDPYFYYGTIASGNKVIKDAKVRDMFPDCLCFETEAAGLMNDFPCLVIRGISDYCDSHKNDKWKRYAAATAAAYAKELLQVIDVTEIRSTPEARTLIPQLQGIEGSVNRIETRLEEQHVQKKWLKIFEWLTSLNPSARHADVKKPRVEGTGLWLLKDPGYVDWSSGSPTFQTMCCYGDPGSGKTVISSLVIDRLTEHTATQDKVGLAYVYCDYRDQAKQTTENLFSSITEQLLSSLSEKTGIPKSIEDRCEALKKQGNPLGLENAKDLLLTTCAEFDRVYICIDALDELEPHNLRLLLRSMCHGLSVQLFVTGRPFIQETVLEYLKDEHSVTIKAHENDIRCYIETELGGPRDSASKAMNEQLKKNIIAKVINSARGMQEINERDRRECLTRLPSNLDEAFVKTMTRIQQQPKAMFELAKKTIAWIHLAGRSFTVDALLCSLAVRDDDKSFDPTGKPEQEVLLRCCHGLIVVDQETSTIRMVHYSFQEYLSRQKEIFGIDKRQWHSNIAGTCLTYLSISPKEDEEKSRKYLVNWWAKEQESFKRTIFYYAATEWARHLRASDELPGAVFDLATAYFNTYGLGNFESYRLLFHLNLREVLENPPLTNLSGHILACLGFEKIILHLIQMGLNPNSKDNHGKTPLFWAARNGHETTTKTLLENGVDINSKDNYEQTPIFWAAQYGHKITTKVLIENGADINSKDNDGRTPIFWAAQNGHETITKTLLENGAVINSQDDSGRTPLSWAAQNGHETTTKVLIENGVDINSKDNDGRTPISRAVIYGQETTTKDNDGQTPIFWAVIFGREAITKDNDGRTPIFWAAQNGHETITKTLLENGAVINSQDDSGRTPLSGAVQSHPNIYIRFPLSRMRVVELLIKNGAKVDSMDENGRTPLSWCEDEEIAELLIQNGAAVDSVDESGRTPLSWVENEEVAKLLIEKGAAVESVDRNGRTPLSWALLNKRISIVRLLQKMGAGVKRGNKRAKRYHSEP
ncbi:ankyrin repeat-containing domain protein [Talaromyces proteolyticus]|uniref:Ankyrin repeat-containing domain protein n=1 Tax=Talaromyces proteolyticus TaxID=1131652 RepID=A0AAD4KUV4_9EURO|nr:ankyrin repeat-containing domain protein [Talaromyces proteolyticus]KAH8700411.1 ankyrin repeat-containing domain protein [Talaromyces proteolyticus]